MQSPPSPPPEEFDALRTVSARLGADPALIQFAGGNTSVKDGGVMWIKASGTLLAEARLKDVFVPVDVAAMRASLAAGEARADRPAEFLLGEGGMRPSIETSLHAVFPQRVVMHVHCVETLAVAIQADAEARLAERLAGLPFAFVPYRKPGAALAAEVAARLRPEARMAVLANHGLIAAGDSVADARLALTEVAARLAAPVTPGRPDLAPLARLAAGSAYAVAEDAGTHQMALTPWRVEAASAGSLYPDHVIFCGIAAHALLPGEDPDAGAARVAATGQPAPPFLIAPGLGVLIRRDAGEGAIAMTRCLADVLARVPDGTPLATLTTEQNLELLDWDAEAYRKALHG